MVCSCACHTIEEKHEPDDCYCMRINSIPHCQKCGVEIDIEVQLCEKCELE